MPKIIDYPRASFKNSLELVRDLDSLGGSASAETVADKSDRKLSGAYRALVSAAVKFGFIVNSKGRLATTELFRELKLSYSNEDEIRVLRRAFLGIPVFNRVYEQFKGRALPLEIFEKVLMREYGVAEPEASRVAGYFTDGAKMCGLYVDDKLVDAGMIEANDAQTQPSELEPTIKNPTDTTNKARSNASAINTNNFSVRISGPGMDSEILINEADDLEIVHVMLRKIAKQLSAKADTENKKPSNGKPPDG